MNHTVQEFNQEVLNEKARNQKKMMIEKIYSMIEDASDEQEKYENSIPQNVTVPIKEDELIELYNI